MRHRIFAAFVILATFALPAEANNPPRPDGVLYLILVFPLVGIATHLAGATLPKRGWGRRIGHGLLMTFLVLASAAGTELGFLAMVIIVIYGLMRAGRIAQKGQGASRFAYAAVTAIGVLLAGAGYFWALWSSTEMGMSRPRQKRTMSDMRTIGTAVLDWSTDQRNQEGTVAEPVEAGEIEEPTEISFTEGDAPPVISPDDLEKLLAPKYLKFLPREDGWNQPFEIRFNPETHELRVRSGGGNRSFDSEVYTVGPFEPLDYDEDIVYADGEFVCWPESINSR